MKLSIALLVQMRAIKAISSAKGIPVAISQTADLLVSFGIHLMILHQRDQRLDHNDISTTELLDGVLLLLARY